MPHIANITRPAGDPRVLSSGPGSIGTIDRLGRVRGWMSFAIGLGELLAAGPIARALGMEGKENLLHAYGVRELGTGMLTLSTEKELGLWSGAAGDGLDLAALATAYRHDNSQRQTVGIAMAMVGIITVFDVFAAAVLRSTQSQARKWRLSPRRRAGARCGTATEP